MLRGELAKLEAEQRDAQGRRRDLKSPGEANIDALLASHRHEMLLAAQRRQLVSQLEQVEAESERRRLAVIEADRNVRVLEKLRERRAEEYRKHQARLEGKQVDELGILGFVHRQEASA